MKIKTRPTEFKWKCLLMATSKKKEIVIGELSDSEKLLLGFPRDYRFQQFPETPPLGFREMKKITRIIKKLNCGEK